MGLVTVPKKESEFAPETNLPEADSVDWVTIAACGSLITGGFLMMGGQRRVGMVVAAAGTALAMLDQQETVRRWWSQLPGYVDQAQRLIDQAQEVVDEISARRDSIRQALAK